MKIFQFTMLMLGIMSFGTTVYFFTYLDQPKAPEMMIASLFLAMISSIAGILSEKTLNKDVKLQGWIAMASVCIIAAITYFLW